jgi:putative DNA primase/helicase
MLGAALDYAQRGWPVFPCHPDTKRPLTPKGEAGTGGLKRATTDEAKIRGWWNRWPLAMIGVPTGVPIGAFVIDIDAGVDDKTGEIFAADKILADLERQVGKLPRTWCSETPRGGRHLFFRTPGEIPIGNRAGVVDRVDVRGTGGYIVAPPSKRADGKADRWISPPW